MKSCSLHYIILLSSIYSLLIACNSSTKWQSVGPASISGLGDFLPCAGRIDAMAISANYDGNATTAFFIAGPGSGIWRSVDFQGNDPHWVPLTDHISRYTRGSAADRDFR